MVRDSYKLMDRVVYSFSVLDNVLVMIIPQFITSTPADGQMCCSLFGNILVYVSQGPWARVSLMHIPRVGIAGLQPIIIIITSFIR